MRRFSPAALLTILQRLRHEAGSLQQQRYATGGFLANMTLMEQVLSGGDCKPRATGPGERRVRALERRWPGRPWARRRWVPASNPILGSKEVMQRLILHPDL